MGNVDLLAEVLLGYYCPPNTVTSLWLLNLIILLSPNKGGGATTLGRQHYFSLPRIEQFTGVVSILRYSDAWFDLVAKTGKHYLCHFQVLIILVQNFNL